jgi:hypothetical protein
MNRVLKGYIGKFVLVYIKDICSKIFDEHLAHLHMGFERLKEAGLSINLEKWHFAKQSLKFLGHFISEEGLTRLSDKVFKTSSNTEEILRLNGMCLWYSSFILRYSTIAEPLNGMLRKKVRFIWTSE